MLGFPLLMKRIGLILKREKKEAVALARTVLDWAQKNRIEVFLEPEGAQTAGVPKLATPPDELKKRIDLMVVLGGDGTLLAAVRMLLGSSVPILGVNLGGLGFLTAVSTDGFLNCLELTLQGKSKIENRMMLTAVVFRGGKKIAENYALNDAVIHTGQLARMIELEVRIQSDKVTHLMADGLIFATPTGSTAYNLSAGGPIVYPTEEVIVMTPICPHILSNRPIIFPADTEIEVKIGEMGERRLLTLDGQTGVSLEPGDLVQVKKSVHRTRLIMPPDKTYYEILRTKLSWAER